MIKHKSEIILIIVLISILTYVGWQAYNTYLKTPEPEEAYTSITEKVNVKEIPEKSAGPEKPAAIEKPTSQHPEQPIKIMEPANDLKPIENITKIKPEEAHSVPEPKGTLDSTGYTNRDILKPSLPVKEKIEQATQGQAATSQIQVQLQKEITLPTFDVKGIVWGKAPPRAIIDLQIYKIGDEVKGAKIIDITEKGIHMLYQGKEFWVTI